MRKSHVSVALLARACLTWFRRCVSGPGDALRGRVLWLGVLLAGMGLGAVACLVPPSFRGLPCGSNDDCLSYNCIKGFCGGALVEATFEVTDEKQSDASVPELPEKPPGDDGGSQVKLVSIEGDGTEKAVSWPAGQTPPAGAKEAKKRFQKAWVLKGLHLDRINAIKLVHKTDSNIVFDQASGLVLGPTEQEGTMMKRVLTLPKQLVAGLFFLVATIGTQQVTLAETFVLQGEAGKDGGGLDPQMLALLQALKAHLSVDAQKKLIQIKGANLQIVNGEGKTDSTNQYGNLIMGYNEGRLDEGGNPVNTNRTGSHNIVIGRGHTYSSWGGFVGGEYNSSMQTGASVYGGTYNTSSGPFSSILAGKLNEARGLYSSVSGGDENVTTGLSASINGGEENRASGAQSSVNGGYRNSATGNNSAVCGGTLNQSNGHNATALGGSANVAQGKEAVTVGGSKNEAHGQSSSILGGSLNVAGDPTSPTPGNHASIAGGYENDAYGAYSSILGGTFNVTGSAADTKKGTYASVAGGKKNTADATASSVCGGLSKTASTDNTCTACP